MTKEKKIALGIMLIIILAIVLYLRFFVGMVLFRIPWRDAEIGCSETVSDLCIFNPFRDRTLERKFQKMIDYLSCTDKKKAEQILSELKKDKSISQNAINFLIDLKTKRPDIAPLYGGIKPRDYFKKNGKIYFVFFNTYNKKSKYKPYKSRHIPDCGKAVIDPNTKKILEFYP
ncbi:hypothetical protein TTHT_1764 [Thermotomaculum hydrothermale]|uniref:Uncharacterized protein n=1 Tax=Thermotomaculum hydrothermale TaxID=981385 RepID=A0A7R6PQ29_9BACT|nr:hypothetical protein [Thermotomaculum hydrothermale]BBB33231.1 hypothetical protein TTHT_1764 [Thermotomaculum hydrothermale]